MKRTIRHTVYQHSARHRGGFPARRGIPRDGAMGGLVISGGRMVDPVSGMDAVSVAAVLGGRIAAIGTGHCGDRRGHGRMHYGGSE